MMTEVYRYPHLRRETVTLGACGHTVPFEPRAYGERVPIHCEVCNSDFQMEVIDHQGNLTCVWYKDIVKPVGPSVEVVLSLLVWERLNPGTLTNDEADQLQAWLVANPRPT